MIKILLLARLILFGVAIAMAIMVASPWSVVIGLAAFGGMVIVREATWPRLERFELRLLAMAWLCSLIVVGFSVAGKGRIFTFNGFFAALAWVIAAGICPFSASIGQGTKFGWKVITLVWVLGGIFIWLGEAYLQNLVWSFYAGLLLLLIFLVGTKFVVPLRTFGMQAINVLILLVIGLPAADLMTRPRYHVEGHPNELKRYYSYSVSRKDPDAFACWNDYYADELTRFGKAAIVNEPSQFPPFHLKPGARAKLFQTEYVINSLGFRGKEVSIDKGDAYRIVALGESTTFGLGLTPEHRPWPELLEAAIRERLKPGQRVEVINAGIPAATLPQNLYWLEHKILALKPDLVISYHGYNAFYLVNSAIPSAHGKPPPIRKPRPLKLLGDAEYGVKMTFYKKKMTAGRFFHTDTFSKPLETGYADAYRKLIEITRANHVRLVLANYSMAVKASSDPDVIEFYRRCWPNVQAQIRANEAHSVIVEQLCGQNPDVRFVDTHPHLDGEYEKFIDLVHFDQEGDQQMAETFFNAIKPVIEKDLTH